MSNSNPEPGLSDHDSFKTFFEMCVPVLGALQENECNRTAYYNHVNKLAEWLANENNRLRELPDAMLVPEGQENAHLSDLHYFSNFTRLAHKTIGYLDSGQPNRSGYNQRLARLALWIQMEQRRVAEEDNEQPF